MNIIAIHSKNLMEIIENNNREEKEKLLLPILSKIANYLTNQFQYSYEKSVLEKSESISSITDIENFVEEIFDFFHLFG